MASAPDAAWTVGSLLKTTAAYFAEKGVDSARLDAELLLARALGCDRIHLYTGHDRMLTPAELDAYRALVRRRGAREPLAYIVGEKEFYGRAFGVTRAVLIPRPETEGLVDAALAWRDARGAGALRVLDLGTGSGCLAVTIAATWPDAAVTATDCSAAALAVARANADRHGVADRIAFREGDLFAALPADAAPFDLVLCNPPYVDRDDDRTAPDVKRYEPPEALYADEGGRAILRRLAEGLGAHLAAEGLALVEIGADQAEAAAALFRAAGFAAVTVLTDLAGRARIVRIARAAPAPDAPPAEYTYEPVPEQARLLEAEAAAARGEYTVEPIAEDPADVDAAGDSALEAAAGPVYDAPSPAPAAGAAALERLLDAYAEGGDDDDDPEAVDPDAAPET